MWRNPHDAPCIMHGLVCWHVAAEASARLKRQGPEHEHDRHSMGSAEDWKASIDQDAEIELHQRSQEAQCNAAMSSLTILR